VASSYDYISPVRLGAVTTAIAGLDFESGLGRLRSLGIECIEIPCAGYVTTPEYGDPNELLGNTAKLSSWLGRLEEHDLEISALALHGQPLVPDASASREYSEQFRRACELAEAAGISRLTLLAGLPEAAPGDSSPCWITSPHPPGSADRLEWQWEERVIPYWQAQGRLAEAHGCRLCFEMHPGDVVYNPASLLRLREAVGPVVTCNFDPSHLFWQGIDPLEALRTLGDAVTHVHAKDTRVSDHNVRVNGLLDPAPLTRLSERAWSFRTVGYGHDASFWRDFFTTLRLIGYDDVVSIEHEDEFLSLDEGLTKGARFLRQMVFETPSPLERGRDPASVDSTS
jgi:sugar phosphate isomerase/epimerase